jgi:hypothetical protein
MATVFIVVPLPSIIQPFDAEGKIKPFAKREAAKPMM